jgi:flagellar biosynthetic protein FliR
VIGPLALYFGLVLARVGSGVAVMPLLGGSSTPRLVKVGLTFALAVFWFGSMDLPDARMLEGLSRGSSLSLLLVLGREMLLGALLGFAFNLFLVPARVAGEFISQEIGLPLATVLGPAADNSAGSITLLLETFSSLLFLGLDLHHVFLAALHATFARYPLGGTMPSIPVAPLLDGAAAAQEMGLLLAAPLGVALFLVTIVLALLTRAAPQLNIYSVGFGLQAGVALAAGLLLMPDMLTFLVVIFGRLSEYLTRVF